MSIPTALESLSTTAASNGPAGSDQRTLADDGLRQAYAFLAQVTQVGANIASASTITPPSTGSSFHITGTTTITAIASTNSFNGRLIVLIFDGALTFTHSSNLALPGSVNITTAANDAAFMRQDSSGAWRCISYQRATGTLLETSGGNLTLTGNLSVQGNTTLGDAGTDTVTTNGNVSVTAPTSGVALSVGMINSPGTSALTITGGSLGFNPRLYVELSAVSQIASQDGITIGASTTAFPSGLNGDLVLAPRTSGSNNILWYTGSGTPVQRMVLNGLGNITINTPSSGTALTVNGVSGSSIVAVSDGTVNQRWFSSGGIGVFGTSSNHQLNLRTNDTTWLSLTTDGRLYGAALHNNAGSLTGTTNQYVASGTYTPTLTNVSNTSALTVLGNWKWVRLGNIVKVSGSYSFTITSNSTNTRVRASLPIASNLAAVTDANGVGVSSSTTASGMPDPAVFGDSTNDALLIDSTSGSSSAGATGMQVWIEATYEML